MVEVQKLYRRRRNFGKMLLLISLWVGLVLGITEAYSSGWGGRPPLEPGNFDSLKGYLRQRLDAATGTSLGSAALLLLADGTVKLQATYGQANPETQAPVQIEQTLYQMASVSKAVTAWGVMHLVETGVFSLDDPVLPYLQRWQFPESNPYRSSVTIGQLLSHTGGLDDGLGYAGFLPGESLQTLEESLTLTQDVASGLPRGVEAVNPPGRVWRYSGGGYTILQLLIEEVTGENFSEWMQREILVPLGMKNANFAWSSLADQGITENLAVSYNLDLEPSPHRLFTATGAASLYASPAEMGRFAQAHFQANPVLSQATLSQMWQPQAGTNETWGLGYHLYPATTTGSYIVGHDGVNLPALNHAMRLNPETGRGLVLLTSGSLTLASDLGDDWIYWETGQLTGRLKSQLQEQWFWPRLAAIFGGIAGVVAGGWGRWHFSS